MAKYVNHIDLLQTNFYFNFVNEIHVINLQKLSLIF